MTDDFDLRPDPKPRRHPELWQMYLYWEELVEARKRHTLRLRDIEKAKCGMDPEIERMVLSGDWNRIALIAGRRVEAMPVPYDQMIDLVAGAMAAYGQAVGPVWDWLLSVRGIGPNLAAKLLALVDDVGKFDTISKLSRHSGHGIYPYWVDAEGTPKAPRDGWKARKGRKGEWTLYGRLVEPGTPGARPVQARDGKAERVNVWTVAEPEPGWTLAEIPDRNIEGWVSPQNKALKSVLWQCGDQFVRQRAEPYRGIYDQDKARLRIEHPEPESRNGKKVWTDGHLHNMAMRKMRKIFLQHLWLVWRESEGLPVSKPWIIAVGGHADYVPPPNWPMESSIP
jgi:hypothetical protein